MNLWLILGVVIAICMYIPLSVQILSGKAEQNLVSWFLWAVLDGVAAGSLILQKGNFILPLVYTLGSLIIAIFIFVKSKSAIWTRLEMMVVIMVGICMVIWYFSGSYYATIASSVAACIAGIPVILDSYHNPHKQPLFVYAGYCVANLFSTIAGKEWSVQERFYPFCMSAFTVLVVIFTLRRFLNRGDEGFASLKTQSKFLK
jgi:hypothetical protein